MAILRQTMVIVLQDFEGEYSTHKLPVEIDDSKTVAVVNTTAATIANLYALMSTMSLVSWDWGAKAFNTRAVPTQPASEPYANSEDFMKLVYACDDGTYAVYQLPGPPAADFLADNETVDPTATHIADWTMQVTTAIGTTGLQVVGPSGSAINAYVRGFRGRKKSR